MLRRIGCWIRYPCQVSVSRLPLTWTRQTHASRRMLQPVRLFALLRSGSGAISGLAECQAWVSQVMSRNRSLADVDRYQY